MPREHDLMDEYNCQGLQDTRDAIETIVARQNQQNHLLERIEKTVGETYEAMTGVYDTMLSDARLARTVSRTMIVVGSLLALDLLVRLGPEVGAKLVRAIVGGP